jgi:hypothetical protein
MVVGMQASDEVVTATTSKTPVFSGNHGGDWTIWEIDSAAYGKGIEGMFGSRSQNQSLPNKESAGPFNLTIEDKKNQKEAVDMNKKATCQFIQAFSAMSLLQLGKSAKESRQALSKWNSMETVGATSR